MRYHHEKTDVEIYACDHPMYDNCTLYKRGEKGLAIVQVHYRPKMKMAWYGPIELELMYAIPSREGFDEYFESHANCMDEHGLYPTVSVRKIMWALKMKPLPKCDWERGIDS